MSLTETVGELLKRPVETACGLIESLLGEPFKIAGSAVADQVAFWQWKNRVSIVEKFQRIQSERKLAIRVLPPDFLLPLIRECGDTSDETLQNAWARLLAAAVEEDVNQHVGYVRILSELSPTDARVLQAIVEICPGFIEDHKLDRSQRITDLSAHLGMGRQSIALSLNNLQRLGLFNVTCTKLSGFAKAFLRVCLTSPSELKVYLAKDDLIPSSILMA